MLVSDRTAFMDLNLYWIKRALDITGAVCFSFWLRV